MRFAKVHNRASAGCKQSVPQSLPSKIHIRARGVRRTTVTGYSPQAISQKKLVLPSPTRALRSRAVVDRKLMTVPFVFVLVETKLVVPLPGVKM